MTSEPGEPDYPLTGGCLCGGVRWEVLSKPKGATYCHCTRCQRRSGTAASAQAQLHPNTLRIVAGEDLIRSYKPADGMGKAFCSVCGSALFSHNEDRSMIALRLGGFDGDPGVRPALRGHVATAVVWEDIPDDGLPRHDGSPWT